MKFDIITGPVNSISLNKNNLLRNWLNNFVYYCHGHLWKFNFLYDLNLNVRPIDCIQKGKIYWMNGWSTLSPKESSPIDPAADGNSS